MLGFLMLARILIQFNALSFYFSAKVSSLTFLRAQIYWSSCLRTLQTLAKAPAPSQQIISKFFKLIFLQWNLYTKTKLSQIKIPKSTLAEQVIKIVIFIISSHYLNLLYSLQMNYTQPGSEIRQSDEILRKLNQIKHAIEDHRDPSPDNLHQYLPKERINSNQYSKPRGNDLSNPQSYRQSLEKKLQRLFKEERKVFNDKQERSQISAQSFHNLEPFPKFDSRDAFTVEKMQNKIKQLERKYLSSNHVSSQKMKPSKAQKQKDNFQRNNNREKHIKFVNFEEENQTPYKKAKSFYEKPETLKQKEKARTNKTLKIEDKSDHKLLTELDSLKKEVRQIKQSNLSLNQKIQLKQNDRRNKKQRSRYLLRCILAKLMQIQEEVSRREKKQQKKALKQTPNKGSLQERQNLIHENAVLIRQVQELNKNLKKQMAQKERAQQRSSWIEGELRKLNRI